MYLTETHEDVFDTKSEGRYLIELRMQVFDGDPR
jgi:hypothetical protein